jgi:hypothetical protein
MHMSWCEGEHDDDDNCIIGGMVNDTSIDLACTPGGTPVLLVSNASGGEGCIWPHDLDEFVDLLMEMREHMAKGGE